MESKKSPLKLQADDDDDDDDDVYCVINEYVALSRPA